MTHLDDLLGFETGTPTARLAREMTRGDRRLVDKLIELRRRQELTQEELAERMGVTQSAVAKFENGSRDPRLSTIRRYALALGVEVTHEVRGEDCGAVAEMVRRGDHVIREVETYLQSPRHRRAPGWNPHEDHHVRVSTQSGVVTLPLSGQVTRKLTTP